MGAGPLATTREATESQMPDETTEELSGAELDALLTEESGETDESTVTPTGESSVAEIIASLNDDATVADIEAKIAAGELSTKDLARGFLREADYTRKTQGAAEERKAAEAEKADAAAQKAALDEREAGLTQDNKDLYQYLVTRHAENRDMTLDELLQEDEAVDDNDDGQTGDEATTKKLAQLEAKIDSRTAADFERDCKREIDVALDAVPDLVPSSKDTKEERQAARADLAESIYERFLLKRADDKGITLADVAKEKLAVERGKQKDRLTLLAEHHKTTKALGRREGAAGGATEAPPPLDLDTLSVGDAQDAGIARAMAKADAQSAED